MSHDLLYLSLPLVPIVNAVVMLCFEASPMKKDEKEDEKS